MRFQVLGDVTLVLDGRPASLSSRRQEQLLALLVCAQGRVVAAETLIDAMWGEQLGPFAGKNLQVLVHRLRKTLDDPERIRHDRSGYALSAQTAEVDAWHFADLAERARGRWTGGRIWRRRPSCSGGARAVARPRLRRSGRRGPAGGGGGAAGAGPQAGADRAPRRRPGDGQTRRGHSRSGLVGRGGSAGGVRGRPADGGDAPVRAAYGGAGDLPAYPRHPGRGAGAGAGAATARAGGGHSARGHPDRSGPPHESGARGEEARGHGTGSVPFLLPAGVGDLTGRDDELRRLAAILRDRPATTPAICAISGMPGVGKTALAVQSAHELRDDFPDGQLYVNLRGAGAEPVEPSHALSRFLRALGVEGRAIPDSLDERAEVFRARLSGRRVLVLLDDAADEAQVEPLIPPENGCAVMITSRSALTALPGTRRLVLGVLTSTAAVGLLGTITGRAELTSDGADGTTAGQLAELCGRLPLALRIAGARLAARPHWTVDRLVSRLVAEHDRLDELTHGALSVRASLALGYSGLTEPGRTLFRRLGLVETPDFAGWVAAALLDAEPRDAEDVLEGLMEAQLIEYAGLDGIGEPRYRIHDLVRLHARERGEADEPPASVRAALTRLTGAYLALAEQAHRRQYGGDYTVLHGEGLRWDCGAVASQRLLADPAAWLRSERLGLVAAVDQAARVELSETCWDLAMTAITLFEAQGHFDDWRNTSETALAVVRRAGDSRGEAAMRYSLGTLDLFRQRYTAARPHFDAALPLFEAVNDQHGQALTLRNAALIERVEGRAGTALRRYRRALRMLREVGDRHAEAHVLGSIAQVHIEHGRADATPLLETALAVYHDLGDLRGAAQILNRMGALHLRQGRTEQAKAAYRQVSAASQAIGDRIGEAYGLLGVGEAELLAGELDPAADHLDAALTLAEGLGETFIAARARLAAGRLAAERGEHEPARSMLDRAISEFAEIGLPVWHERAVDARRSLDATLCPPLPY